jgi:pimeloyl-ACP methyl ester carboxylesterase
MIQIWRLHTARGQQSGWLGTTNPRSLPARVGLVAQPEGLSAAPGELGALPQQHWLVLHGGPGSGANASMPAPFFPANSSPTSTAAAKTSRTVWAPHQRGSAPTVRSRAQRVSLGVLVQDLEALRAALGLSAWSVLGGSWGASLALAYASRHPKAVQRLVLRGSFLAGSGDVWALLQRVTLAQRRRLMRLGLVWPTSRLQVWPWLRRLRQRLDGAASPAFRASMTNAWQAAEARSVLRGAKRAVLHAMHSSLATAPYRAARKHLARDLRRTELVARVSPIKGGQSRRLAQARVQAQVHMLGSSVSRELRMFARTLSAGCTAN